MAFTVENIQQAREKILDNVSVPAGRLKLFLDNWRKITDDKFILSCISGYKIPLKEGVFDLKSRSYDQSSQKEPQSVQECLNTLLNKNAIRECLEHKDQILSPYFLVKKPNGSDRFILNLKGFNEFVVNHHFKIEDIKTVVQLTFPNYFLASIDIEDAFYLIPIHEESRKFLRFKFKEKIYEFVCLPFGLCTAPYIFTKIMKVVAKHLRSLGFTSVIYLDDILCIESSANKCKENINETISVLEWLGFRINYKKSNLTPSTSCHFLGFIIDTQKYAIMLPDEKRKAIHKLLVEFLDLKRCSIRKYAQLIGKLISACPAIEYGWMYTKILEKEKIFQLIINDKCYDKMMTISDRVKQELVWWKESILEKIHHIKDGSFAMVIFTDASSTGWGAWNYSKRIYGFWSPDEQKLHINFLELYTIKLALESLASNIKDSQILLRVDNTTALSYVNKMGGVRFDKYNKLAREIWKWAESRGNILIASYIPTKQNIIADSLSRIKNIDIEWELNDKYYRKVVERFGEPEIDLFASNTNNKCKVFVSWKPQSEASYIDAFTIVWTNLYFYAFPPFSLILRTLAKIKHDKAEGIIILPLWKSQPWFPLLENLIIEKPLIFKANPNLLLSPCRSQTHPQAEHLNLIACRVSGKPLRKETSR